MSMELGGLQWFVTTILIGSYKNVGSSKSLSILIKQLEKFDEELKHHAWIEENIIYKKIRENRMTY